MRHASDVAGDAVSSTDSRAVLSDSEREDLLYALEVPRGRYSANRAAQLSGVPERTVYHWARHEVMQPDFDDQNPKSWSYRDLVYLRLLAFLRGRQVALDPAAELVRRLRREFAEGGAEVETSVISAGGGGYALGPDMQVDMLTGQVAFETMVSYVGRFDLLAPIEAGGPAQHLWGPNLVRPSARTEISPWVLSGEPVIESSRIPTATIYALTTSRNLAAADIADLYPGLDVDKIRDAVGLERRLRQAA